MWPGGTRAEMLMQVTPSMLPYHFVSVTAYKLVRRPKINNQGALILVFLQLWIFSLAVCSVHAGKAQASKTGFLSQNHLNINIRILKGRLTQANPFKNLKILGNIFLSLSYFLYFSMIFERHCRDSGEISETLSTKQFFNTLILILLRITISFPQGTLLCFNFKDRHAQSTLDLWDWHQRWAKSEYICYQVPLSLCLNWACCVQCNCVLC